MSNKVVTTDALSEVLSIIKKDINTNSTNISTIQESLNTVQTDLTEIKKIIKDINNSATAHLTRLLSQAYRCSPKNRLL